jgi:hypothetical protein
MHGPTCIFWANLTPFSLRYVATHDDVSQTDGNASQKKSDPTDTREADGADLSYLVPSRMLLEDLYDTKLLAYMVLYYEYVIRHGWQRATLPFRQKITAMAARLVHKSLRSDSQWQSMTVWNDSVALGVTDNASQ